MRWSGLKTDEYYYQPFGLTGEGESSLEEAVLLFFVLLILILVFLLLLVLILLLLVLLVLFPAWRGWRV